MLRHGALVFFGQKRSFQVGAQESGAANFLPADVPNRFQAAQRILLTICHNTGIPDRYPLGSKEGSHLPQILFFRCIHIHPDSAVRMDIDEPGHHAHSFSVQNPMVFLLRLRF